MLLLDFFLDCYLCGCVYLLDIFWPFEPTLTSRQAACLPDDDDKDDNNNPDNNQTCGIESISKKSVLDYSSLAVLFFCCCILSDRPFVYNIRMRLRFSYSPQVYNRCLTNSLVRPSLNFYIHIILIESLIY